MYEDHERYILKRIRGVCLRLNAYRFLRRLARWLFYGLLICIPPFLIDSLTSFDLSPLIPLWLGIGITSAVLTVSLVRPIGLYEAARRIDEAASLKDRTISALEFIRRPADDALTELQIRDTFNHLRRIPNEWIIRRSVPREAILCVLVVALLILLSCVEFLSPQADSTEIDYSPLIAAETQNLFKQIEEMKREAERMRDKELQEMVKRIERKALGLKKEGITPKEALARLSELSMMLKSKMESAKVARMESLMKGIGERFAGNPILRDFGRSLRRGEYEKAAKKLKRLGERIKLMDKEKRQNLSDELKNAGKSLEGTELDSLGTELAGAGSSLADDDLEGTRVHLCRAGKKLMDLAKERLQALLLAKLLTQCQMAKLGIAGSCCAKGMCSCEGIARKSNSPSNKAGKATDPNPFGEPTDIDSNLRLERITGIQGKGPSYVQISKALESGKGSKISYRKIYAKYRKLSEDVLSREDIPLGYKFYVKRYFESIRPQGE